MQGNMTISRECYCLSYKASYEYQNIVSSAIALT